MKKKQNLVLLAIGMYFGWLLAVPFNGPVLFAWHEATGTAFPSPMLFSFAHALSLLGMAFLWNRQKHWYTMMYWASLLTILLSAGIFVLPSVLAQAATVLLGFAAALFLLGWSVPYTKVFTRNNRMKYMALAIVLANLILYGFSVMLLWVPITIVVLVTMLFPVLAFLGTSKLRDFDLEKEYWEHGRTISISPAFLGIFCLLIFGLYINGGFMYNVMYQTIVKYEPIIVYFRQAPYILVLLVMWFFGDKVQRQLPVYLGVSLMGTAFVAFTLVYNVLPGALLIELLTGASFALLDLFFLTVLADIASMTRRPMQLFGWGMAATVAAVLVGGLLGSGLMVIAERYQMLTAMFAFSAIFLTYLIIPWTFRQMDELYLQMENKDNVEEKEVQPLPLDLSSLTNREAEITDELVKGLTYKEIAAKLYVSENTIKTHIKNLYAKLQVKNRKELLTRMYENNTKITHSGD